MVRGDIVEELSPSPPRRKSLSLELAQGPGVDVGLLARSAVSPRQPSPSAVPVGQAIRKGPHEAGGAGVGADVSPDFLLDVFGKMEVVLPEFLSLAS